MFYIDYMDLYKYMQPNFLIFSLSLLLQILKSVKCKHIFFWLIKTNYLVPLGRMVTICCLNISLPSVKYFLLTLTLDEMFYNNYDV